MVRSAPAVGLPGARDLGHDGFHDVNPTCGGLGEDGCGPIFIGCQQYNIYIYMCNFLPDYVLDVCAYIQTDQIGSNTMILHLGKHGDNQRVQKMIILHHIPLNKRWSTGSRGRKSFGRVSDVV